MNANHQQRTDKDGSIELEMECIGPVVLESQPVRKIVCPMGMLGSQWPCRCSSAAHDGSTELEIGWIGQVAELAFGKVRMPDGNTYKRLKGKMTTCIYGRRDMPGICDRMNWLWSIINVDGQKTGDYFSFPLLYLERLGGNKLIVCYITTSKLNGNI